MPRLIYDVYDIIQAAKSGLTVDMLNELQDEFRRLYIIEKWANEVLDEFTDHSYPLANNQKVLGLAKACKRRSKLNEEKKDGHSATD